MTLLELAREAEALLSTEARLVRLAPDSHAVFVGDIHGDVEAVEQVFTRFRAPGTSLVFLGDLVDRGPASREALTLVLTAKLESPETIHLLMGNHEAWGAARFSPADFWQSLSPREASSLAQTLLQLPLAAWHEKGVLALHGALPDFHSLADFEAVAVPSPPWRDVTWGDWSHRPPESGVIPGRPRYDEPSFVRRAQALGLRILVRSHQPDAPTYLFADRCLTLFTSAAYGERPRRVAVLAAGQALSTARDLALLEV